jgi:hypothetical protein
MLYRLIRSQNETRDPKAARLKTLLQELAPEVRSVLFLEADPLVRQIVAGVDSRNRAYGDACAAVDALDWIDEELIDFVRAGLVGLGVDAVYRTGIHTRPVLGADAGFCDYIRHVSNLLEAVFVSINIARP